MGKNTTNNVKVLAALGFTEREIEAFVLMAEGNTDQAIADDMELSYGRIRELLNDTYRKLNALDVPRANRKIAAIRVAVGHGFAVEPLAVPRA